MVAPSTIINEQNPWPWLDPFDEEAERFFNGRSDDAAALLRMVRGSPVTVLFGKSGLGKTSLLQAGLFPALRKERLLPVYVRLGYNEEAGSLQEQLWNAFVAECKEHKFSYREANLEASRSNTDSLWLYLHHQPLGLAQNGGPPWQPIFVLDQFEEIFTLGSNDSTFHKKLFSELGDLLENRIPRSVMDRTQEDDDLLDTHDLDTQPYRFLVSLREDYLPDLEIWCDLIPRLGPNRYRLLPMTWPQALEAVQKTGGQLVTTRDAERIVDYVTASGDVSRSTTGRLREGSVTVVVEPALLSLVCSGLNAERLASNAERNLNTENLAERGSEILEKFYDDRVAKIPPEMRDLIENELITNDGIRRQYPLESAIKRDGVSEAMINTLVDRRILRIEPVGSRRLIELVHDRLASVALRRKQEGELEERARRLEHEQKEASRRLKRNTLAGVAVVSVLTIIAFAMFFLWKRAAEQERLAKSQSEILARQKMELEKQTSELERALEAADNSKKDADESAKNAGVNAQQAKEAQAVAERESQRAQTALIQATSVRLAAEGQAIVSLSRPGNSFQGVVQILAAHRILAGVEPYFAMQSAARQLADVALLIETGAPVLSVAFSPDGKRIVSGSYDRTLRLWDAATGKAIGEPLKGHSYSVRSVAFSPDGKRIVSGSDDRTLRLWDAATGKAIGEPLKGHSDSVRSVAFSPDGKQIVSGSGSGDGTLRLWDAATGKPIGEPLKGHSDSVRSVAFSPDGKRIVSGSYDRTLRLWDAATGKAIGEPLKGHSDSVQSVAFSPDGKRIVSGSYDRTLRLWDAATGKAIGEPLKGHSDSVGGVAFSPDGKRIVSGSGDSTLRLWDAATGKPIGEPLKRHSKWVWSVAFSPDGKRIVSGSGDSTLRLWDAATGKAIGEPLKGHSDSVGGVAFSPDGKRIVSGSGDSTLRLWDAATGKPIGEPLKRHSKWVSSVAFSPDGKRIVSGSGDSTLRLWDAATGKPIGEPLKRHSEWVSSVAFSPDGKRIVSGSGDDTLRLWDAATGKAIGEPLKGHSSSVLSVAFNPDGKQIVSGSGDGTLRLWDGVTGKPIGEALEGHSDSVLSVAFSPDGKRIVSGSGSGDGTLRLWDAATRKPIGEPLEGHSSSVRSVAFSPDGKRIVSGSYDRTLRLWDAATRKPIGEPLKGHSDSVQSVAFSPDGKRIVSGSGSGDGTLRLWDVLESWADELCGKLPRNMTHDEWKKWVGDIPYQRQCPNLSGPPDEMPVKTQAAKRNR